MQKEHYTDDAICTAMGLGPFVPVNVPRIIRLLLKPSFHSEVCVTIEPELVHIVGLRSMLWRESVPCRMPDWSETAPISDQAFESLDRAFKLAAAENAVENAEKRKFVTIDGMSVSAVQKDGSQSRFFAGHPHEPKQKDFLSEVLRLAHDLCTSIYLRNAVAECGRYVDNGLVIEPEPVPPQVTRLLILGKPTDLAEK